MQNRGIGKKNTGTGWSIKRKTAGSKTEEYLKFAVWIAGKF
jgi:hypothetical protein